jgi:GTP cyclohydrolase I
MKRVAQSGVTLTIVETSLEASVVRLLEYVGEDPQREGLLETPKRVAKAWKEWCSGYAQNPADVLKVFEDGANGVDEMVVVRAPVYSHCEHHLAAIFGTAVVAYIPDGKIVGLSKIKRLVDVFARRLQVQERLTNQIADALQDHLKPKGVGVVIKARHMCMESRGVNVNGGEPTITSALRGLIKTEPDARAEFLDFAK